MAVQADPEGSPRSLQLSDRWVDVAAILDRWRLDEEWWRQEISRLYYLVLLEDGMFITVFHDLVGGRWYQQSYQ